MCSLPSISHLFILSILITLIFLHPFWTYGSSTQTNVLPIAFLQLFLQLSYLLHFLSSPLLFCFLLLFILCPFSYLFQPTYHLSLSFHHARTDFLQLGFSILLFFSFLLSHIDVSKVKLSDVIRRDDATGFHICRLRRQIKLLVIGLSCPSSSGGGISSSDLDWLVDCVDDQFTALRGHLELLWFEGEGQLIQVEVELIPICFLFPLHERPRCQAHRGSSLLLLCEYSWFCTCSTFNLHHNPHLWGFALFLLASWRLWRKR